MNIILNISQSNVSLKGPTSTSTQIMIAQNFAGKGKGVILQLAGNYEPRFDVSWLSRYNEEAKRIFIHGCDPMELVSVD